MKKQILLLIIAALFANASAQAQTSNPVKINISYYDFIKHYVEKEVNEWTKPQRLETAASYHKRVNETTRNDYAKEKEAEAKETYAQIFTKDIDVNKFATNDDTFDWDTGTLKVKSPQFDCDFIVKVGDDGIFFVDNFSVMQRKLVNIDFSSAQTVFDIEFKANSGKTFIAKMETSSGVASLPRAIDVTAFT